MTETALKRVVRFNHWISPEFGERLARESDLTVTEIDLNAEPDDVWRQMAVAHLYQVSAAVNELPERYRVNEALLARCPELLCVSSGGAGYDTVDVAACTKAGVAVVNQAGGNSAAVAEMAIGLMLAVSRRIAESDQKLRTQQNFSRESLMGHDLGGKTLGLVGLGHAGSRVAVLASAFGMQVLAVDPYLGQNLIRARGAEPVTLDQLIERADIVSVHCPRDQSTVKMFNADRFQKMKAGALFISTARGGIHDETALYEALVSGHLRGAGLDVWDVEPPPLNHPLLSLSNVVATFHTAGVSHQGRAKVASMSAEQIVGVLKGDKPSRLINPEVWDVFLERYRRAGLG